MQSIKAQELDELIDGAGAAVMAGSRTWRTSRRHARTCDDPAHVLAQQVSRGADIEQTVFWLSLARQAQKTPAADARGGNTANGGTENMTKYRKLMRGQHVEER